MNNKSINIIADRHDDEVAKGKLIFSLSLQSAGYLANATAAGRPMLK